MKKNNRKGFTIVELVIVIAVIAILAAVLIPTFSGMVNKANDSATLQEARNRYTNYTAEYDYTAGGAPEQNLAIEVGDKYVVVKDGQMEDTIYKTLPEAKTAAAGDETYVLCETHTWTDGTCTDCTKVCKHDYADAAVGTACGICGKAKP